MVHKWFTEVISYWFTNGSHFKTFNGSQMVHKKNKTGGKNIFKIFNQFKLTAIQ